MKENSIEEDIEILEEKMNKELDFLIENANKTEQLTAISIIAMKEPIILLFLSILSDYKRVLKEKQELKQEKIDNHKMIALAQNEVLGYMQGYEDGKNSKTSAIASIVENQQYYIIKKQMEKYEEHIEKLQKENEELNKKENKIYKEVQESLSFEKFLVAKKREPDLFNQGRFYISQIIYDILNNVENPEGIYKENKYIKYIDYIPVQKVKDKIEEIQNIANELSQEIEEELKSEDICQEYIRDKRRERGLANRDIKLLQELLEGK